MGRPKNSKNKVKSKTSSWYSKKPDKQTTKLKVDSVTDDFNEQGSIQGTVFSDMFRGQAESEPLGGKKRKVAPRSGLQFKVGPSFESTTLYRPIFITSTNENVFPFVNARIDRGFENHGGEWIGYKRNYFTLVSCFEFDGINTDTFFKEKFHILNDLGELENISCFALRLVSRCSEDDSVVNLIQHTAKRDRGPQYLPPVFPAVSGYLPSHSIIKQASNIRNGDKIDQYNRLFFLDNATLQKGLHSSILSTYPEGRIATVARYERIQFSASLNYRKSAMVNRHFVLKVELLGLLDDGYAVLASTETQPLVVRGRSPSNYQMAKRNLKAKTHSEQNGSKDSTILSSPTESVDFRNKKRKSKYSILELQKSGKKGRKKKDPLKPYSTDKIHPMRTYHNQTGKELYNLEDELIDDDLFPPIIQARHETFDSIFESFPLLTEFNLNLQQSMSPNASKNSKSPRSKMHHIEAEKWNRPRLSASACRSQGSDNSSFIQGEDDSFTEFQKELCKLQQELKSDFPGDKNILGLVS